MSGLLSAASHEPAAMRAAGLSTSHIQKAANRGTPTITSMDYPPSAYRPHHSSLQPSTCATPRFATADIEGSSPSSRPLQASSYTPSQFHTQRTTCPLQPRYNLPGPSLRLLPSSSSSSSSSMLPCRTALPAPMHGSLSITWSGTSSRRCSTAGGGGEFGEQGHSLRRPTWGLRNSLDVSDIVRKTPLQPIRPLASLSTSDIGGATCGRSSNSSPGRCRSPGHGTLYCADITGASPGRQRPTGVTQLLGTESYMSGRWPAPQTTKHQFDQTPRRTVLQRPLNFTALEGKGSSRVCIA